MNQATLEREALKLPLGERALLADTILSSLDSEAMRRIETAWAREAESRLAAYRAGKLKALDGPRAVRELRARYK